MQRQRANEETLRRMIEAEPVLEAIRPALEALPGMTRNMILTSGPALPWNSYTGGQRAGIVGAAVFESLAADPSSAEQMLASGEIIVDGCQNHGCVGSLAGIYTASMPVFVVRDKTSGKIGCCNFYEGTNPRRLNYGVYDEGVRARLLYVNNIVAPVIADAVDISGGVPLKPIIRRALHMGDELHSRSTAASLLFTRELFPHLLKLAETSSGPVDKAVKAMTEDQYFFLRLSMAAAKATAEAAHGVEGSSVVTAMCLNCREFAIRVGGLGDKWFIGPPPTAEAKLFDGHKQDEISWMGGESTIVETVGLGGFAQAAAFPLQSYQGGSPEAMVKRNNEMYRITVGEHKYFQIPALSFRGTPTGIDIFKVLETGIVPVMDMGIAGRDGGQIGAGVVKAPIGCFELATAAYKERYGS